MPDPYDPQNIFAKILRDELPALKVLEDDRILAFMDIMPRGAGHCLVIPKIPVRNILDADESVLSSVALGAQKIARASMKAFEADGITIQQFNESAGGQIVFHYHVHIIPRFEGVRLSPPGIMAEQSVLEENAQKLRAHLSD